MFPVEQAYKIAKDRYAAVGVDTDVALQLLSGIPISMHCWQGDDLHGFENDDSILGGGLVVTGNYPGKARNADELRTDLEFAFSLIPGRHRLSLHSIYAESGGQKVDRDTIEPDHFRNWIEWAKIKKLGLDFNPTFFAHPLASDGFTLSHTDKSIRQFWIDHGIACRRIGSAMGSALGSPCVTNVWIPDGSKDLPVDRKGPRERLSESLDVIFNTFVDSKHLLDAVESKLFGIGSESYVVGSHEFYLGYAIKNHKVLCLDMGHFHPTESIADKLSAVFCHLERVLLHTSRGIRWDSDHVPILSDELQSVAHELVRGNYLARTNIGLDFFDASINRIAAWIIGIRSILKALLVALLEPIKMLRTLERQGDCTYRLATFEEQKSRPWGAVWDYHCHQWEVPLDEFWIKVVKLYESEVLNRRG